MEGELVTESVQLTEDDSISGLFVITQIVDGLHSKEDRVLVVRTEQTLALWTYVFDALNHVLVVGLVCLLNVLIDNVPVSDISGNHVLLDHVSSSDKLDA